MRNTDMSIMEQKMQEQMEGSEYEHEQLRIACVNGSFIKKRYIKCPHTNKKCEWRLGTYFKDRTYLNGSCYLSGSFKLECPN